MFRNLFVRPAPPLLGASNFAEVGRARILQNYGRLDLVNRLAVHPVWTDVARSTRAASSFDRINE